jgi:Zinc finger, C3HC4 type (RING finger)
MLETVLDQDNSEKCAICMDTMVPNQCSRWDVFNPCGDRKFIEKNSLQCEHIFCNVCLPKIATQGRDKETFKCSMCRRETPHDEIQTVQYSAREQWDGLLDIAKEWGELDTRSEEEMSEEETAVIDDNDGDTRYVKLSVIPVGELEPFAQQFGDITRAKRSGELSKASYAACQGRIRR